MNSVTVLIYVHSLVCNKMASNREPCTLEYRETQWSMFLFTKIEIASAVPQKISRLFVLVSYYLLQALEH